MDFLHGTHRQSRVSEVVYVALNLGLATLLFLIVLEVQSPWLALALVIASKWRALAVRPRFWLANIVANMIDLTVGISVVMLMYAASGVIWLQVVLAVLHALLSHDRIAVRWLFRRVLAFFLGRLLLL